MNGLLDPIATILAATIGAIVVIWQIGRQARHAIRQSRVNEALKLKLEVYKDIIGISRDASNSITDLSSFVRQFHSILLLARQMQAEMGGFPVPSAHPSSLIEKRSRLSAANIGVMAITETWQIIEQRIDIFRIAINAALYDIDIAYQPYFHAAYHAMPVGVSEHPVEAPTISWVPPPAEALQEIEALGNNLIDALMTLQSYIFDFQREMQNLLLGEMFGQTIPPRDPIDSKSVVIRLSKHDELSRYFAQETNWGLNQARIENEIRAGLSPSLSGTS